VTDNFNSPDRTRLHRELQELALWASGGAAAILLEAHKRSGTHQVGLEIETKSSATDLVTQVDRAAEEFLREAILSKRPDDGILGEEGTSVQGSSGIDWVIDPLDGTTNFVYGHPGFAVSIGISIDNVPSVGVVHDPLHGDIFSAKRGEGAYRNGQVARPSQVSSLELALVATGFSYSAQRRAEQAHIINSLLPQVRDIRRMGSAALDLCSAACGRVDAYFEFGLAPWDMAGGAIIASEAGLSVGGLAGSWTFDSDHEWPEGEYIIAAPPELFGPLRQLLNVTSNESN